MELVVNTRISVHVRLCVLWSPASGVMQDGLVFLILKEHLVQLTSLLPAINSTPEILEPSYYATTHFPASEVQDILTGLQNEYQLEAAQWINGQNGRSFLSYYRHHPLLSHASHKPGRQERLPARLHKIYSPSNYSISHLYY